MCEANAVLLSEVAGSAHTLLQGQVALNTIWSEHIKKERSLQKVRVPRCSLHAARLQIP